MNLKNYYRNIPEQTSPKSDFITAVANDLNVSEQTVRLWVYGKTKPRDPEHLRKLSVITEIPEDQLFTE